ncbi:hypothetical protein HDV05_003545 [Chytridiales sp. JEL 0842]|nr:hypothetical protein HDV05_003545 [Chytridiales sp. JEL 0842]
MLVNSPLATNNAILVNNNSNNNLMMQGSSMLLSGFGNGLGDSEEDSNDDVSQFSVSPETVAVNTSTNHAPADSAFASDKKSSTSSLKQPKKRPRATPTQVGAMEQVFAVTHHPDAAKRKQLAQSLGMTERSVQIWFQNKRARLRTSERRSNYGGSNMFLEPLNTAFLNHNSLDPSSPFSALSANGSPRGLSALMGGVKARSAPPPLYLPLPNNPTPDPTHPFKLLPCNSLLWGTWRRTFNPTINDLCVAADTINRCFHIIVCSANMYFQLFVPFDSIRNISYIGERSSSTPTTTSTGLNTPTTPAPTTSSTGGGEDMIVFDLSAFPSFYILSQNTAWHPCADFTEHAQASSVLRFTLHAPTRNNLLMSVAGLVACDEGLRGVGQGVLGGVDYGKLREGLQGGLKEGMVGGNGLKTPVSSGGVGKSPTVVGGGAGGFRVPPPSPLGQGGSGKLHRIINSASFNWGIEKEMTAFNSETYAPEIRNILLASDLKAVTAKTVRRQLEDKLQIDLSEMKQQVNQLIMTIYDQVCGTKGSSADSMAAVKHDPDSDKIKKEPSSPHHHHQAKVKPDPDATITVKTEIKSETRPSAPSSRYPNSSTSSRSNSTKVKSEAYVYGSDEEEIVGDGGMSQTHRDAELARQLQLAESRPSRRTAASSASSSRKASTTTTPAKRRGGGGFNKPYHLSAALQEVCGTAEPLPRSQVVKKLWEYIKSNNLQLESNKKMIRCDDKLKAVFKKDTVDSFKMQKTLSVHLKAVGDVTDESFGEVVDDEASGSDHGDTDYSDLDNNDKPSKKRKVAPAEKDTLSPPKRTSLFSRPYNLSPALASICSGTQMARHEVVKRIWVYIKAHNLQKPENRTIIICDDALKRVFDGAETVTAFSMNKYFSNHLTKVENDAAVGASGGNVTKEDVKVKPEIVKKEDVEVKPEMVKREKKQEVEEFTEDEEEQTDSQESGSEFSDNDDDDE